jgi:hypothetical protein
MYTEERVLTSMVGVTVAVGSNSSGIFHDAS